MIRAFRCFFAFVRPSKNAGHILGANDVLLYLVDGRGLDRAVGSRSISPSASNQRNQDTEPMNL